MVHYRPILFAKRGELTALAALPAGLWSTLQPVFQVPPREWDFGTGGYKKSLEDHIRDLPQKLATATRRNPAFLDVSLLDTLTPVFGGVHPMTWLIDEAVTHGLELIPFINPDSDPATLSAAADVHVRLGRGVGIRLPAEVWVSIDARRLPRLLTTLGVGVAEVDLFVDVSHDFGLISRRAALTELDTQDVTYAFRSRTVGGAGFPETQGLARGLTEHVREDWTLFRDVHRARRAAGVAGPDFFDNAIQNPSIDIGSIDPRLLSISALFRYTADEQWFIAKGELYKGPGGRSRGSAAMRTPLTLLSAHPKYGVPLRTDTDVWIDAVVAGTQNGGNPEGWRRWATQRHLTVVAHQIASPI